MPPKLSTSSRRKGVYTLMTKDTEEITNYSCFQIKEIPGTWYLVTSSWRQQMDVDVLLTPFVLDQRE